MIMFRNALTLATMHSHTSMNQETGQLLQVFAVITGKKIVW